MDNLLENVVGREVVDAKQLAHGGFAILFDDGIIVIVSMGDNTTWTSGPGFLETWDMIEEGS